MANEILVRVAFMILNAASAALGAYWLVSVSLSGFETSQNTLSGQIQSLSASLDSVREISDAQLSEARGDLSEQIGKLTASINGLSNRLADKLDENSTQVAALNATLAGVDKRLTESIQRQLEFERAVMLRMVLQGPIVKSGNKEPLPAIKDWVQAGYTGELVFGSSSEVGILKEWERLGNIEP